jgi:hypothetical protein
MRNLHFLIYIAFILTWISCSQSIQPSDYLSEQEEYELKYKIIRYAERLPKHTTHETKFDSKHDSFYMAKANSAKLIYYFESENGERYFALAKIAPSLKLKRVSTIGKFLLDKDGDIEYYEEICRTWKMEEDELFPITKKVFNDVIKGKDISKYYTKNSQPELIIEFPDDNTFFDVEKRLWKTKN